MNCIWIGSTGAAFRIPIFELFPYFGNWYPSRHVHPHQNVSGCNHASKGHKLDMVYMALAPGAGKPGGALAGPPELVRAIPGVVIGRFHAESGAK
jgi:hypothetical protein